MEISQTQINPIFLKKLLQSHNYLPSIKKSVYPHCSTNRESSLPDNYPNGHILWSQTWPQAGNLKKLEATFSTTYFL